VPSALAVASHWPSELKQAEVIRAEEVHERHEQRGDSHEQTGHRGQLIVVVAVAAHQYRRAEPDEGQARAGDDDVSDKSVARMS
jgi:hypothetical protein